MMDDVGPEVVPTVASLRTAFDERRGSATGWARVLNRLLGMEAKLAQYRDGAAFVRAVVDVVGHDGLNLVWTAPEHLPRATEIAEPALWVRRVHG
jgi:putative hydrolase